MTDSRSTRQAEVRLYNWTGRQSPPGRLILEVWNEETRQIEQRRSTQAEMPPTIGQQTALVIETDPLPSDRMALIFEITVRYPASLSPGKSSPPRQETRRYPVPIGANSPVHIYLLSHPGETQRCRGCSADEATGMYIVQGGVGCSAGGYNWPVDHLLVPVPGPSDYLVVDGPWPEPPSQSWDLWTVLFWTFMVLMVLLAGGIVGGMISLYLSERETGYQDVDG